jgi:tetratricopeptide (TPR) repeat protein
MRQCVLALLCALAVNPASAHDSPGDVIHALSHRMELEGPTARLLAARAFEYQSLGQWNAAIADFDGALALQPRFSAALQGLAEAHLRLGNWTNAESAARRAVALYDDDGRRAPGQALLAQVMEAQTKWPEALDAWREALKAPYPEVDWFLGESRCLGQLGRYDDQAAALALARSRNPSVVLHRAWVRAMVDGGQLDTARTEIETGLEKARWQSSWLLLRARVHAREGDTVHQHEDARTALAELQGRINPERPDTWLVTECAIALALAGDEAGTREYEKQARALGVPGADLLEINQLLAQRATAQ